MTLLILLAIPLAGALFIAMSPARQAKWIALGWTLIALVAAGVAAQQFHWNAGLADAPYQFEKSWTWIKPLGVTLSVGVDSVAMLLILLTALLGPVCVLGSWTAITERAKLYYASLLVLQTAMTGVFCSRDIILFYLCFEFTLAPMYILIRQWGSSNRLAAATKFFLYTFTGSMLTLAGLVYVAWRAAGFNAGEWSFAIDDLQRAARMMSGTEQAWVLLAMLAGFAVKVPLFPVHTWLPLAHTEAPTAGSVILAGVLLKLGAYGMFRFTVPFLPEAVGTYAPAIAVLALIGVIYTGLICWAQRDVKKLVAYSSVSHLGFCVLGMMALNTTGLSGSVLYMVNHGLSTGAMFLCIGFMYERYHTRSLDEIGGLASRMPVWSMFMMFFVFASVGLPGLNGFVSEFMCMLGAFQSGATWGLGGTLGPLGPWYAAVAATGMVVSAIYLLYMAGKLVFGPLREPHDHGHGQRHSNGHAHAHAESTLPADLTAREITALLPLAVACLALGVYPTPVIRSLDTPIMRIFVDAPPPTLAPAAAVPQEAAP